MTRTRFETHLDLDGVPVPMATVDVEERRGRPVRTEFTYAQSYLARKEKLALDPDTPLLTARHVREDLPRGLLDAGPDGWGRRLLLRANRGREMSETDFLLGVDDASRIGALRFTMDGLAFLAADADLPRRIPLARLLDAAHAVERDPDDLTAVRELLAVGSGGLGGVRPKAAIDEDGVLSIAKFPSTTDEIEVVAWEKLYLELASRAGIPVPASRLLAVGGARVLVLERFDRAPGSRRIPYLSAFALTSAPSPDGGDYLEIGDALAELDTADLRAARRDLWRRAAFNVLMRNTDDHLKNHGVLWGPEGWRLSPVFDLTPDPVGGSARATAIDGEDRPAREARALRGLAAECEIPAEQVAADAKRLLDAVASWRDDGSLLRIPERDVRAVGPAIDRAHHLFADEFGLR
ncbi:MAG: type II toxin-antitoxin system HipA family toxin [Microbacteriaceae bacterium]|nr:type II toxin-antitoxin system HipA family toxin [Microbacteriaceae bacterium]